MGLDVVGNGSLHDAPISETHSAEGIGPELDNPALAPSSAVEAMIVASSHGLSGVNEAQPSLADVVVERGCLVVGCSGEREPGHEPDVDRCREAGKPEMEQAHGLELFLTILQNAAVGLACAAVAQGLQPWGA
jgi:hypothetical protein